MTCRCFAGGLAKLPGRELYYRSYAHPQMKPSLTDTLCTRCGLCCDGSLFADVELANRVEATTLEVMGLEIEDADENGGGLLGQPCAALIAKRCTIYAHRPDCCDTFECRLLQAVKRGTMSEDRAQAKIADALRQIERVQQLTAELGAGDEHLPLKERCAEALGRAEEFSINPRLNRKRAELQAATAAVERLIQRTFLHG